MNNTAIKIPQYAESLVDIINDYKGSNRCDWAPGDYEISDCSIEQLRHMMNRLIWRKDKTGPGGYQVVFSLLNKAIKRRL